MKKEEEMWAGKFGDEYHNRNSSFLFSLRQPLWSGFLKKYKPETILEVGCGDGRNLCILHNFTLITTKIYGIDININILPMANTYAEVIYGQANDIPFKDNFFDLVFTCGLLIHIPPDDLLRVMSEMVRCSRKYVMFMEYWAKEEEKIKYRDGVGLWKRPYKDIFIDNFLYPKSYLESENIAQLNFGCIDEGFLNKDDGFDDVTWWLFERR